MHSGSEMHARGMHARGDALPEFTSCTFASSRLPPLEAPVMIAERSKLIFSFVSCTFAQECMRGEGRGDYLRLPLQAQW